MELGRGGKAVLLLAAVTVVIAGIKFAAPLFVPFLLATFVTIVTAPGAEWLRRRGLPGFAAVTVTVLADLAALVAIATLIGSSLKTFYDRLPAYQGQLESIVTDLTTSIAAHEGAFSASELSKTMEPLSDLGFSLAGTILRSVAGVVSNLLIVVLLVLFMLLEVSGFKAKLKLLVPAEKLARFRRTTQEVQKYLVVKTAASLTTGLLVGLWVAVLGVDLPWVWGLLAFLLNYVPSIGSIIAAVPPVLVALLEQGAGTAGAVAAGYLTVNISIGNLIEPRVLGRTLGLSPLVVVLSIFVWGWVLGPVGALLAVPLTMVCKIIFANTEDFAWVAVLLGPSRRSGPGLRQPLPAAPATASPSQPPPG